MTTSVMRKRLIAYLSEADDKKIKGLYSLLEDTIEEKDTPALTDEQLAFLNKERSKHFQGKSKSYSWEDAKNMIRKRKAS